MQPPLLKTSSSYINLLERSPSETNTDMLVAADWPRDWCPTQRQSAVSCICRRLTAFDRVEWETLPDQQSLLDRGWTDEEFTQKKLVSHALRQEFST